jgi:hypothetical protein
VLLLVLLLVLVLVLVLLVMVLLLLRLLRPLNKHFSVLRWALIFLARFLKASRSLRLVAALPLLVRSS